MFGACLEGRSPVRVGSLLACVPFLVLLPHSSVQQAGSSERIHGHQKRQLMIRAKLSEVSSKNVTTLGFGWGKAQPEPGAQLNLDRIPPAGGAFSALITSAAAQELRTLFPSTDAALDIYVTDSLGTDVIVVFGATLEAVRSRANHRSLAIFIASGFAALKGD